MPSSTVPQLSPAHKSNCSDPLDHPIAFRRAFATITGSANAGLMLSQAFYWSHRTKDSEGWFYKTQADWEKETALSRSEQETARRRLRATTFWHEKRRGLPAKLYFRVDLKELERVLRLQPAPRPIRSQNPQQNHQSAEIPQTSMLPSSIPDGRNPADQFAEIPPTMTETTAKTPLETPPERETNVVNVGIEPTKPKRRLRLTARQAELVEELENQFDDTHSRGAFCRIVSDAGLGEDIAYRLLRETLEQAHAIRGPLGAYFIDACKREAQRQGIDLHFKRPG
jgi:hypothetical protein